MLNRREFICGFAATTAMPCYTAFGCGSELIEYAKTCTIVNLEKGLIKFNPRPYQIKYLSKLANSEKMFVCRKCRQCGATTMNLIYAHWIADKHPEKKVVLVFLSKSSADDAKDRYNTMFYDNPNTWAESTPSVMFKTYLGFINDYNRGNGIMCDENCIFIFDEYAFMLDADVRIEKALIDSRSKLVFTSSVRQVNDNISRMYDNPNVSDKMTICGDMVFNKYELSEYRKHMDHYIFKREIFVI